MRFYSLGKFWEYRFILLVDGPLIHYIHWFHPPMLLPIYQSRAALDSTSVETLILPLGEELSKSHTTAMCIAGPKVNVRRKADEIARRDFILAESCCPRFHEIANC